MSSRTETHRREHQSHRDHAHVTRSSSRTTTASRQRALGQRLETAAEFAYRIASIALLILLCFISWCFGGVTSASQILVYQSLFVIVPCALLSSWIKRIIHVNLAASMVLLASICFGLMQLVPLPATLLQVLSPEAITLRGLFGETVADLAPLSLYPASTRFDVAMLSVATLVFALGAILFYQNERLTWLVWLTTLNGLVLSSFGIVREIRPDQTEGWLNGLTNSGASFGPFANRNNAGGFLLLCLACILGPIMTQSVRGKSRRASRQQSANHQSSNGSISMPFFGKIRGITAATLAQFTLLICLVFGVLCARTRGAFLGMMGGSVMLLFAALFLGRLRRAISIFVVVVVIAIGFLSWTQLSDRVATEYSTLTPPALLDDGRVHLWRDALQSARHFSFVGSGYGTYRYVYRYFEAQHPGRWAYHAENQYLEALLEGGVVGLGLLIAMISVVISSIVYVFRHSSQRRGEAIAWIAGFALTSQVIHGFVDFGLYIPANMLLLALICGSVVGRAAHLRDRLRPNSKLHRSNLMCFAFQCVLVVTSLFLGKEVVRAGQVEQAAAGNRIEKNAVTGPIQTRPNHGDDINVEISRLEKVLNIRPDDAEGHDRLAALLVDRYRQMATAELRAHFRSQGDESTIHKLADLTMLRYRGNQFARSGDSTALLDLRAIRPVQENLLPALEHLLAARQACPLLPSAHLRLAELSFLMQPPENSAIHLDRAQSLLRNEPYLLYYRGWLYADDRQWTEACACWRECLAASSLYLDRIMTHVRGELEIEQIVNELLPSSPRFLVDFAKQQYVKQDQTTLGLVLTKLETILDQEKLNDGDRHYYRGCVNAMKNRFEAAIQEYRTAVTLEPRASPWRFEFAILLKQQGRLDEARDQAQLCFATSPDDPKNKELLQSIIRSQLRTSKKRQMHP